MLNVQQQKQQQLLDSQLIPPFKLSLCTSLYPHITHHFLLSFTSLLSLSSVEFYIQKYDHHDQMLYVGPKKWRREEEEVNGERESPTREHKANREREKRERREPIFCLPLLFFPFSVFSIPCPEGKPKENQKWKEKRKEKDPQTLCSVQRILLSLMS